MRALLLIFSFGLVIGANPATAEVYKWTDAQGNVHFSDKPAGDNAEKVAIATRPRNTATVRESGSKSSGAPGDTTQSYSEQRAQAQAEAEARKLAREEEANACDKARERLREYINARRLYRRGEDGERVYLSAKEIDGQRAKAESDVAEKCR